MNIFADGGTACFGKPPHIFKNRGGISQKMARKLSVVLYTMNDCPFCSRAKDILREMKVIYAERNVSGDARTRKELVEKTKDDKLPTLIINDTIVLVKPGEDKLRATLNYELHR
jgi:glutaredoxin 3